jgi:hypothetical protein
MEQLTYTLTLVASGTIRHRDDDINTVTVHLFTDGNLWEARIEENGVMSLGGGPALVSRAIDENLYRTFLKAAARSRRFKARQLYHALGINPHNPSVV